MNLSMTLYFGKYYNIRVGIMLAHCLQLDFRTLGTWSL